MIVIISGLYSSRFLFALAQYEVVVGVVGVVDIVDVVEFCGSPTFTDD